MAKSPHHDTDDDNDRESNHKIIALEREITKLHALIGNVVQASAIENVLSNGFESLSAQLQPLRDLSPTRKRLPAQSAAKLQQVLVALARPAWTGSSFDIVREDRPDDGGCTGSLAS